MRRFLAARGAVRIADFDDVSQEVFLRLLRYDNAQIVEHPQAYLFKMAANVVAEWAIRPSQRLAHEPGLLETLTQEDRMDEILDNETAQQEVKRAVAALTSRERAVLRLHFEEGLTHAQIAQQLRISIRIVRRDFEKSYGKLRRELNVELTGALHHGRD